MAHFYVTNNTTQAITSNTVVPINFQTEISDTESAYTLNPTNEFSVPSGLNGQYMIFTAGYELTSTSGVYIGIERSTDSGSNWDWLTWCGDRQSTLHSSTSTGPVLLATGDLYRASGFSTSTRTIANADTVYFGGVTLTEENVFRAVLDTNEAMAANVAEAIAVDLLVFDTIGGMNLTNHKFTVPAALHGKVGAFYADLRHVASQKHGYIEIVQDLPTEKILARYDSAVAGLRMVETGPIILEGGSTYYARAEFTAITTQESTYGDTYFSGWTQDIPAATAQCGFRVKDTTQTLTSTEASLQFDTIDILTHGGLNMSGTEFTVPSVINGAVMTFTAGYAVDADRDLRVAIEKSTTGGSTWDIIAREEMDHASNNTAGISVHSGPETLSTGDIYRVRVQGSSTAVNFDLVYFSGWAL